MVAAWHKIRLTLVVVIASFIVIASGQVSGHGLGEQKLERVESGPFRISAWVDPIQPSTDDEIHITVAVEDDEGLVRNAEISVQMAHTEATNTRYSARATHEQAVNKLHYEAPFTLSEAGDYAVTIDVSNHSGAGAAAFTLLVTAGDGRNISPGWVAAGVAGAAVMILVVWNRVQLARSEKDK